MSPQTLTVLELAPAADELWELDCDPQSGYLRHEGEEVVLPDVAAGAKLRPGVTATYAGGKATNVARVCEALLRPDAEGALARRVQDSLRARLVTFLAGEEGGRPDGAAFTPGGVYVAALQARDFAAVELGSRVLPASCEQQADRRCVNVVARDGKELVNFSPYLLWEGACAEAAVEHIRREQAANVVALAGSLPLVDGAPAPDLYARIIRRLRKTMPDAVISLDVGGAPLAVCLEGGSDTAPDVVCINADEYADVPGSLWRRYAGLAVVHDKRGCWMLRDGETFDDERAPDVRVPEDVRVVHTIGAGDAAHGGLLLGLMLYGTHDAGVQDAMVVSQACALTVVESAEGIRGLRAQRVERNVGRLCRERR